MAKTSRIEAEIEAAGKRVELVITLDVEGERARRVIEVDGARRRAFDLPGPFPGHPVLARRPGPGQGGPGAAPALPEPDAGAGRAGLREGAGRSAAGARAAQQPAQADGAQAREAADVLEVWNEELVQHGDAGRAGAGPPRWPSCGRRRLGATPRSRPASASRSPISGLRKTWPKLCITRSAEDLRRGSTSVGPHRDDLKIVLDGEEARSYASQGQQRTAVVSLKLAEAALIRGRTGERPVLLLDDVLSELDGERRAALLREVGRRRPGHHHVGRGGPVPAASSSPRPWSGPWKTGGWRPVDKLGNILPRVLRRQPGGARLIGTQVAGAFRDRDRARTGAAVRRDRAQVGHPCRLDLQPGPGAPAAARRRERSWPGSTCSSWAAKVRTMRVRIGHSTPVALSAGSAARAGGGRRAGLDGPVRVVAGAGTGKTAVIAERFRRLVAAGAPTRTPSWS